MGLDLILRWAALPAGTAPDWTAAEDRIEGVDLDTIDALELIEIWLLDPTDPDLVEVVRRVLRDALAAFRSAIEIGSRELAVLQVRDLTIYASGGLSAGELPTDLAERMEELSDAGILDAAGFIV